VGRAELPSIVPGETSDHGAELFGLVVTTAGAKGLTAGEATGYLAESESIDVVSLPA